jgi:hypothetical protein
MTVGQHKATRRINSTSAPRPTPAPASETVWPQQQQAAERGRNARNNAASYALHDGQQPTRVSWSVDAPWDGGGAHSVAHAPHIALPPAGPVAPTVACLCAHAPPVSACPSASSATGRRCCGGSRSHAASSARTSSVLGHLFARSTLHCRSRSFSSPALVAWGGFTCKPSRRRLSFPLFRLRIIPTYGGHFTSSRGDSWGLRTHRTAPLPLHLMLGLSSLRTVHSDAPGMMPSSTCVCARGATFPRVSPWRPGPLTIDTFHVGGWGATRRCTTRPPSGPRVQHPQTEPPVALAIAHVVPSRPNGEAHRGTDACEVLRGDDCVRPCSLFTRRHLSLAL